VRILHTSDWHVGRTIRGRSRANEHQAVLAEIAWVAANREVDLVLVAGDVFDAATPPPEAERIVYRALLDLAHVAPVVMVAGNHDHPRRLQAVAPLLELGRVSVGALLERPESGGVVEVPGLPARVALVPFVSQRAIVRIDDLMASSAADHGGAYAERMASVIDLLCRGTTTDQVNLVVGHVMVHGGVLGGGERSAHTIFEYSVPALAFPGHLSYVALGHLHRQQRVPGPAPLWYSGSPLQLDFGEVADSKGVLVVDVEPGLPATVDQVALTTGRRLVRLEGTLDQVTAEAASYGDAWIQVVLDEPSRAGLADEVRHLIPGTIDVLVSRPADVEPASTGPSRIGRTPHDLFAEYLEHRKIEDPRLLRLFGELLAEVHERDRV
jgi:DNA repair protein SbcD/Mre11